MKELTNEFKDTEVKVVSEQQQKKQKQFIGSTKKKKGHTLFEFNTRTKEITPAKFKVATVSISSFDDTVERVMNYTVITNPDCLYMQALNKKNVLKKLKKPIK